MCLKMFRDNSINSQGIKKYKKNNSMLTVIRIHETNLVNIYLEN